VITYILTPGRRRRRLDDRAGLPHRWVRREVGLGWRGGWL